MGVMAARSNCALAAQGARRAGGVAYLSTIDSTGGRTSLSVRRRRRLVFAGDGVGLAVTDYGSGAPGCPTVVFLHGLCLSQTSWTRQIHSLLRRYSGNVRVISYDHRGHGSSAAGPIASYRPEQLADDLAQLLAELGIDGPLVLVGHSLGAIVALSYLARSRAERPVDPDGLVLVATAAGRLVERGLGQLLAMPGVGLLCQAAGHAPEGALHAVAAPVCAALSRCGRRGPSQRATLAAVVAAAVASTPVATALGFLPGLRSYDAYPVLAGIRARTVIIGGEADVLTPLQHSRDLAAGIPGAQLISLPGVGHMLPQQAPAVIDEAIRSVLGAARFGSTVDELARSGGHCDDVAAPAAHQGAS